MEQHFVITGFSGAMRILDRKGHLRRVENRRSAALIFTVRGRIRFTYEGGFLIACPGSGVFLPQGISYLNVCEEEADSFLYDFTTMENNLSPCGVHTPAASVCERQYEDILQADLRGNASYMTFSQLYALFAEAFAQGHPAAGLPASACAHYIHTHYSQYNLTLDEIAESAHISKPYLHKLFRREYGVSPHSYLHSLRMEKARSLALLRYPVSEIAHNVGYMDIYQFSRAYKQYFGCPPSKQV